MNKQEIRKILLGERSNLTKSWVISQSKKIHRRLVSTKEFQKAKTIMFYITKNNEVETKSMVELALRRRKTVCAPCVDRINHKLHPAIIKDQKKDLMVGTYNILEPRKKTKRPKKIDLVILPGIAFDVNGHRLGWGKAYYDRFLKNLGYIHKIGLAFDFQILNKLPVDIHDISMDKVITEKRIIKMTNNKIPCLPAGRQMTK